MQLHKRMSNEKVTLIFSWYEKGVITKNETMRKLGLRERRFYKLLKEYRDNKSFNIVPKRTNNHRRISPYIDRLIRVELEKEKTIINDKRIPLCSYNFSAIRDEVVKISGKEVSAKTVSNRARDWGYVNPPKQKKSHDRIVLTTASGLLLQHDSSTHLFAPFGGEKWTLITTIDDYSRMLLYAEFVEIDSTWAHIRALEGVATIYGVGANYYVDNHSIFRLVKKSDSIWNSPKTDSKTALTQWKGAVRACGMDVIYALSPQAKGKIERPYRWLQDRIVRRCAKENIKTIEEGRIILKEEVARYNEKQVHSTTGEIPIIRFKKSIRDGDSVFRKLELPKPYISIKDVFCIKETRIVNGYRQISFRSRLFKVPDYVPKGAVIVIHLYPDSIKPEVRLWYKDDLFQVIILH